MQNRKEYQPLTLPQLQWNKAKSKETFGELVVSPLEPGLGITIGNALRRVLLSSIEGSAVTSVIIKGVNNEFSTIEGVVEDVLYILLNIKELVIKNSTGLPGKMTLRKAEKGPVLAGDIVADDHLKILNKDHVIAHLAQDGALDIEFFVETGRGYSPAKWPSKVPLQKDGRIYLDAAFSPIRRVEYKVEKTRVGQEINYDKLLVGIETDGTVSPAEVVHYGTSVLRTQLEHLLGAPEIPFNKISRVDSVSDVVESIEGKLSGSQKGAPVELFLKPIDELEFSVRAHNCLISAGIKRVIDLVNLTEEDVLKIKNFGRKSLREVKDILKAFDLDLGMNIKELDLKKMIKEQEERS